MARGYDQRALETEPSSLSVMSRDDLHLLWRRLYRTSPPRGLVGDLLRRTLAWRLQPLRQGIREAELWKRVAREARAAERRIVMVSGKNQPEAGRQDRPHRKLRAGTRLIREWKGETHEVVVLPDGFLWKGVRHRSLSIIAWLITGTSWNGWLFFGVAPRKAKETIKPSSTLVERPHAKAARIASEKAAHV